MLVLGAAAAVAAVVAGYETLEVVAGTSVGMAVGMAVGRAAGMFAAEAAGIVAAAPSMVDFE